MLRRSSQNSRHCRSRGQALAPVFARRWERAGRVKGASAASAAKRTLDAPKRSPKISYRSEGFHQLSTLLGSTPQVDENSATIMPRKETLKAVLENGVFRPLKPPKRLAERREVTLTVTVEDGPSSLEDFGGRTSSDDAQEMREVIEREFERVDPREWR
jgi:predicted DNA-binding antitoxin AbrB/MazE fold protein